jgi:hypothetical protein
VVSFTPRRLHYAQEERPVPVDGPCASPNAVQVRKVSAHAVYQMPVTQTLGYSAYRLRSAGCPALGYSAYRLRSAGCPAGL